MRRLAGRAAGVAWRTLKNVFTNPALLFPSLMFPLFFFTAFAGGLSQVSELPGFDFPPGYTAFQFVLRAAPVGRVRRRLHRLRDRARLRVRLRPPAAARGAATGAGSSLGYALAALARWTVTATVLTVVALDRRA